MPFTERTPLIPGQKVIMRGVEFVIPALTLGQAEYLEKDIATISDEAVSNGQRLSAVAKVLESTMKANYPEITLDEVKDLLDMKNYNGAFLAALGQEPAGETVAAANGATPTAKPSPISEAKDLEEVQGMLDGTLPTGPRSMAS